jgi:murein L,D-transpeptidase YcbB/YkuD
MTVGHGRAAALTSILCAALLLGLASGCSRDTDDKAMPELRALLAGDQQGNQQARGGQRGQGNGARNAGKGGVSDDVAAFYQKRGIAPVWLDGDRPAAIAERAIEALAAADDHALRPEDYEYQALSQERQWLAEGEKNQNKTVRRHELARFELRLTTALLTLGRDAAIGRTDPRKIDPRWKRQRELPDLPAALEKTIAENALPRWVDRVGPVHPEYARLRKAWAGLRPHRESKWTRVQNVTLRPGQSHAAVAMLRYRLIASGELPPDAVRRAPAGAPSAPSASSDSSVNGAAAPRGVDPRLSRYDATMVNAVRAFQEHQGIKATGTLDARTVAALNVPISQRVAQVALNLERWRWMPDDLGARHIRVNIPQFYVEAHEHGRPVLSIRAIVGKEGDETPIFSESMTHVVFSPYWNIPPAIAADETLPAAERDPDYLERNDIEVVRVSGGETEVIDPADLDWTDEEAMKGVAFRQRPGSANALGFVKFMFPNPFNVYIHDTPADSLFQRLGRTLSHGCVRIEDPVGFATYVLRDQPRWTRDAIMEAMHAGDEKHVRLSAPIPVHIVYFTAWADEQGGLHFRDDVYGFDAGKKSRTAAVARAS